MKATLLKILATFAVFASAASVSAAGASEPDDAGPDPAFLHDERTDHDHSHEEEDLISVDERPLGEIKPEDVAAARARFGLSTEASLVSRMTSDKGALDRGADWGVPLTEDELAEMLERDAMAGQSQPVFDMAADLAPGAFGGAWIDAKEGVVVVSYTDDARLQDDRLARLREVSTHPDRIRIVQHKYTLEELHDGLDRLYDIPAIAKATGIDVLGVTVQHQFDRLTVSATNPPKDADSVIAEETGVLADMIYVEHQEPIVLDNAPRGGHRIQDPTGLGCSTGAHATNAAGIVFLVTAGHCDNTGHHTNGGIAGTATHGATFFVTNSIFEKLGPIDAQAMRHGWPAYQPAPTGLVKRWAAGRDYRLVSAVPPPTPPNGGQPGDRVGDTVCQAGHRTMGVGHCGPILSTTGTCWAVIVLPNGAIVSINFVNRRNADYGRTGGDSGATVYYKHSSPSLSRDRQLAGIHSGEGCGGAPAGYSFQGDVLQQLPFTGWVFV